MFFRLKHPFEAYRSNGFHGAWEASRSASKRKPWKEKKVAVSPRTTAVALQRFCWWVKTDFVSIDHPTVVYFASLDVHWGSNWGVT